MIYRSVTSRSTIIKISKCRYIVARLNGDDAWFWGAYEDLSKAYQSANEINGIVIVKDEVEE